MRLINSDGQVCDAKVVAQPGGNANRNSITLVDGRLSAVVICAALCGICTAISFTVWRSYHDDAVDIQDQYQKERNHVIELEARLKILGDEVQEMKHERR